MTPSDITSLIDEWAADEQVRFLARNDGHYINASGSYAALRLLVERAVAAERERCINIVYDLEPRGSSQA